MVNFVLGAFPFKNGCFRMDENSIKKERFGPLSSNLSGKQLASK